MPNKKLKNKQDELLRNVSKENEAARKLVIDDLNSKKYDSHTIKIGGEEIHLGKWEFFEADDGKVYFFCHNIIAPEPGWNSVVYLKFSDGKVDTFSQKQWAKGLTALQMYEFLKKIVIDNGSPVPNTAYWKWLQELYPIWGKSLSPYFTFSPDFRSVNYNGEVYALTSSLAKIVEILYNAWEKGTPEVSTAYISEQMEGLLATSDLRDSYRKSKIWKTLLVSGTTKGTLRLNI